MATEAEKIALDSLESMQAAKRLSAVQLRRRAAEALIDIQEAMTGAVENSAELTPEERKTLQAFNNALQTQVGGSHYKNMKIQPMEFSMANKLDACQHTIVKYVTRFREKGGQADLEKARHTIDMLIQLEYGTPK